MPFQEIISLIQYLCNSFHHIIDILEFVWDLKQANKISLCTPVVSTLLLGLGLCLILFLPAQKRQLKSKLCMITQTFFYGHLIYMIHIQNCRQGLLCLRLYWLIGDFHSRTLNIWTSWPLPIVFATFCNSFAKFFYVGLVCHSLGLFFVQNQLQCGPRDGGKSHMLKSQASLKFLPSSLK